LPRADSGVNAAADSAGLIPLQGTSGRRGCELLGAALGANFVAARASSNVAHFVANRQQFCNLFSVGNLQLKMLHLCFLAPCLAREFERRVATVDLLGNTFELIDAEPSSQTLS
jgi:hypothetical protein